MSGVFGGRGGECLEGRRERMRGEWVEYGISLEK
jgi:hypothetical protein